ncbi:predicted protein [Botrytis cinerea T4]|uniref:Uncharacterized protein n=1 Tax=Botryotinia fuckeliana (strain T4) TaxID=999810 RepID=G2YCU7_BOTF4|nr:predicted protein [Botrytis cinerea T4]
MLSFICGPGYRQSAPETEKTLRSNRAAMLSHTSPEFQIYTEGRSTGFICLLVPRRYGKYAFEYILELRLEKYLHSISVPTRLKNAQGNCCCR